MSITVSPFKIVAISLAKIGPERRLGFKHPKKDSRLASRCLIRNCYQAVNEQTAGRGQFEKIHWKTARLSETGDVSIVAKTIHVGLAPFVGARFHEQPVRAIHRRLWPTA